MASPNVFIRLKYYKSEDAGLNPDNPIYAKKIKNRTYYSSNQPNGNDYMKYMDNGSKAGEVYDYMAYAGNEEKSSGVFVKDGLLSEKNKKEIRRMLRETKSVIWDMIISFTEDYGNKHIKSYWDALEVIKKNFPNFFKENGMQDDNIIWFAGLHENTDNKHIHICFFEKEPLRIRQNKNGLFYHVGTMKKVSINDLKVAIEEQMNGNEYAFASYRNELMVQAELALKNHNGYGDRALRLKLKELYRRLPKGRISYNSLNMVELRPLVREIERILMERNPYMSEEFKALKKDLEKKDIEIRTICESQKINAERYLKKDKFIEDFHRRIGNKIIRYAKTFRDDEENTIRKNQQSAIRRKIEKSKRLRLFKETARLTREVDYEAIDIFTEYRQKLAEAEYQRLVEEGVIEAN